VPVARASEPASEPGRAREREEKGTRRGRGTRRAEQRSRGAEEKQRRGPGGSLWGTFKSSWGYGASAAAHWHHGQHWHGSPRAGPAANSSLRGPLRSDRPRPVTSALSLPGLGVEARPETREVGDKLVFYPDFNSNEIWRQRTSQDTVTGYLPQRRVRKLNGHPDSKLGFLRFSRNSNTGTTLVLASPRRSFAVGVACHCQWQWGRP
jgi:hypothetical protein